MNTLATFAQPAAVIDVLKKQEPWERPEVAALIPETRARISAMGLNEIEKSSWADGLLAQIVTVFRDKDAPPFYREDGETDAQYEARRQAHNNQVWAEWSVLRHLCKGCELTE